MFKKSIIAFTVFFVYISNSFGIEPHKVPSAPKAASAALKSNIDPIKFETPLIAIPEDVKKYVSNLGAFVELQRLCTDSVENKKNLQQLLTRKEDSLQLVYGLTPIDYRDLLEKGADAQELFMKSKSDSELKEICGKFLGGIVEYINTSKKEDEKLRANMVSLEKELGVKRKLEQSMKGSK